MSPFAVVLAVLGCAALVPAQDDADVRIESLPGPLLHFATNGDEPCSVRIVDALTARPLPGALLHIVRERTHPIGGEFWFESAWPADADGFVRLPGNAVPEHCWLFVGADGYGPLAAHERLPGFGDCVELLPGLDWPVDVRDVFDRPLGDVELGLCLGCGHTPDVRHATSDAAGRAVLRGVEPAGFGTSTNRDLYPRGAGLAPEYHGRTWQLGDPPTQLRLPASRYVRGRVRSPNGRPLPGVAITSDRHQHRGPWSITDADGVFAPIAFVDALVIPLGERQYEVRPPAVAESFELTLPAAPLPTGQPKALVTVVVQDDGGRPLPGCRVDLWHVGVGSADPAEEVVVTTDADGQVVAELVAGELGLVVTPPTAAWATPAFGAHRLDVVVAAAAAQRLVVSLPRWPTMRVRATAEVRAVTLVTRTDEWPLAVTPGVESAIAVPGDEAFALRVEGAVAPAQTRYHVFAAPPRGVVAIAPEPATPLRLRVVDARGAPVAARVSLLDRNAREPQEAGHTDADGRLVAATERVGCAFVRIEPDRPGLRCLELHVGLPRLGQGAFDLGDVVLSDAPALRVLRADGRPARGSCDVRRPGLGCVRRLADDGGWDGPAPRAGDRVAVQIDDDVDGRQVDGRQASGGGGPDAAPVWHVPFTATLQGDGPWTLRRGSARLHLTICDDYGLFADGALVLYGAEAERLSHHTVELRDLPAGVCELFVGARSCDSAKVRVTLRDGEERRLEVVLRRRIGR